jgi:mitochondrial import inner membrane translocase subunit TIM10
MTDACHNKCISSYKSSDLSVGEGVCIDRCVLKYMEVQGKVKKKRRKDERETDSF